MCIIQEEAFALSELAGWLHQQLPSAAAACMVAYIAFHHCCIAKVLF
jgi:hypothetical protein